MLKYYLTLFCLAGLWGMQAQPLAHKVVAPAGKTFTGPNFQLDWTLGEIAVQSFEQNNSLVTLGFHQPDYDFISATDFPSGIGTVKIYPNPVVDHLNIELTLNKPEAGQYELYDSRGQLILSKIFNGEIMHDELNVSSVPAGAYNLVIILSKYHILQPVQILKIQ